MLKVVANDLVLFGLSERNIEQLKLGHPIDIDMAELGLKGHTVIFYGETEAKMRRDLASLIGPDTVFKDTTGEPDA